jgi:hypothetical protein
MSLVNTLTQNLRTAYPSNLDKNEDRLSQYGAYELFRMDTTSPDSVISSEVIDTARISFGNTLQVPVIDGEDVTIGNVRSCTIPDYENTSQLVTVTFVTYQFGFTMVPAQYFNNDIGYQADFNNKMRKYLKALAVELDTAGVTKLEADKTQVWNTAFIGAGGEKYGPLVGDAVQVTDAQKNLIFNDLTSMMSEDDFEGRYNVLGSQPLKSVVAEYANQGAANATNTMFQFGDYSFGYSNRVAPAAGKVATFYAMPEGTMATMNRNEPDAIAGTVINSENFYGVERVPIVDLDMGFHYSKDCGDQSAVAGAGSAGLTAAVKEQFIWSTDVAFITAYNRDPLTLAGPIHKGEISAT